MVKRTVKKERNLNVVKQNDIVQKARYNLDLVQQKAIMYLISKIDSVNDIEFQDITVDLNKLCEIMGIQKTAGKNIKDLKNALQKLADKSMWVDLGDKITLMRWLSRVSINKGTTEVTIQFDELMAPYLLQIKDRFVQYKLVNVLPMKSQYSLRLYELIKSYENLGKWEITVEELKKLLFLDSSTYPKYQDFRRRILTPAVAEICNFTDLTVAFTLNRRNRAAYSISFVMCSVMDENWTEGKRRMINQEIALDRHPAEVVFPQKKPTVEDVYAMQERQRQEKIKRKAGRAKNAAGLDDFNHSTSFMPGQLTIDDFY